MVHLAFNVTSDIELKKIKRKLKKKKLWLYIANNTSTLNTREYFQYIFFTEKFLNKKKRSFVGSHIFIYTFM